MSESILIASAVAVGLDREVVADCLESSRFKEQVRDDWCDAQTAGVRGPPTFLINDRQVFPTYNAMTEAIDEILGTN